MLIRLALICLLNTYFIRGIEFCFALANQPNKKLVTLWKIKKYKERKTWLKNSGKLTEII